MKNAPQLVVAQESPVDIAFDPFNQIANNIAAPVTYTINPPATWCYWAWILELKGGLLATHIQELKIYANTTLIYNIAGADLDVLNQWYRLPASGAVAGSVFLWVPFRRFNLRSGHQGVDFTAKTFTTGSSKDQELESALNCGSPNANGQQINTLKLDLVMNTTPSTGALQVVPYGLGTIPWQGGPGLVPFLETTTFNASLGRNWLTKNNGIKAGDIQHTLLDGLFLIPATSTLDNFEFWYQNALQFQRSAAKSEFIQALDGLRTWQAGWYPFDLTADGYGDENLLIAAASTDIRIGMDCGAAGSVKLIQRSFGFLF